MNRTAPFTTRPGPPTPTLHHHIIGTAPITHQTKYQIQKKKTGGGGGEEEKKDPPPPPPPVGGYCSHDHKITMDFWSLETKNSVQSISARVSKYFLCQVFVVVLFFALLSSVCLFFFVTVYDLFYNCRTTKLHYLRTRNVQTKSQHQSQARRGKLPQSSVGLAEWRQFTQLYRDPRRVGGIRQQALKPVTGTEAPRRTSNVVDCHLQNNHPAPRQEVHDITKMTIQQNKLIAWLYGVAYI